MTLVWFILSSYLCFCVAVNDGTVHTHPKTKSSWISAPLTESLESRSWKQMGSSLLEKPSGLPVMPAASGASSLPDSFDARKVWSNCSSIRQIYDESTCGASWAFAAVGVMNDRYCISENQNEMLSVVDLLSCCSNCGRGCEGGYPTKAWEYWKTTGITKADCRPFPYKPCAHTYPTAHYRLCTDKIAETPTCAKYCDWLHKIPVLFKGHGIYQLPPEHLTIMYEIQNGGPVQATFEMYEDFRYYRSGIYHHAWGKFVGYHSVRLIGWGVDERRVPYWLAVNSWNSEWGENGTVRFLRGFNECQIEENVIKGTYSA